jgi:phosphomannomutase
MTEIAATFPPLDKRPIANTICLFDVDGTLTLARRVCANPPFHFPPNNSQTVTPEMLSLLSTLRQNVAIGFVGGSDLAKQQEQLGTSSIPVTDLFDFCFAENGLTAYKSGVPLASHSFIKWLGEPKYKELVKFILHYVADLDIPVKRGTFVEFRNGMINVSPIGRNASIEERNEYERYDKEHKIRETFVGILREKFGDLGLT